MKKLIFPLIMLSILWGCKKNNDTAEKTYTVKYYAAWHGFELATCYYHYLTYRIGDSTVATGPFTLRSEGSMTCEYQAKLHDTLKITFMSYQPANSHTDTLKIFCNNQLVRTGSDSCIYVIRE